MGSIGALLAGAGMPFLAERTGSWVQAGMIFTVLVAMPLLIMLRATRVTTRLPPRTRRNPTRSTWQNGAFRRVALWQLCFMNAAP